MIKNFKWLLLVSLTFVACNNNNDDVIDQSSSDGLPLTAGSANFTKYVALGDSFAAGFSDGALFKAGQEGAYPNILAQQFATIGGGEFKTPFMADNIGGFAGIPTFGPRLWFNGSGPVPVQGSPTTNFATVLTGGFNNFGVPGAKSFHLVTPGYGTLNPYFGRFASESTTTVLADAKAQSPSFFSLWIGGNDVLGFAMSGGTGEDRKGDINLAAYGSNDITDPGVFASVYNNLITNLTSSGAKGVVANLPYVNTLPFFTTVPANPVPLTNATQVGQLNGLFGAMNASLIAHGQAARFQTLQVSVLDTKTLTYSKTNPLLIVDESMTYDPTADFYALFTGSPFNYPATTAGFLANLYKNSRHANSAGSNKDYIVLSARASIGATQPGYPATNSTIGVTYPMPDGSSLTYSEVGLIKIATDTYNTTIKSIADSKGLAFVDAKSVMDMLSTSGITSNGFKTTSTYVTGGAFSLDGVHPSPRGYALIANEFIKAINAKYGSNLKGVDLSNYRIMFPPSL